MATVNTNDLRIKNAENLIDSVDGSYIFIGRPTQWDVDIAVPMMARKKAGDQSPPYPDNNWKDYYQTWNQMLALKRISPNEAHYVIPRITWISGTVFDMYRHDYSELNLSYSKASNLYDAGFYVVNQARDVYVCLDNNNNKPSLVEPLNTGKDPFFTSDGYQWLRLYNITLSQMRQFSTNNLIPVVEGKCNDLPAGAIYTVVIDSPGEDISQLNTNSYYCKIKGDGEGAVAKVSIHKNRVSSVMIERPGIGYTYGQLDFRPNKVYANMPDLDAEENALNPEGDGTFRTTVIISPPGGWGYTIQEFANVDEALAGLRSARKTLARQLGATRVCVFSSLKYDTTDFTTQPKFRQIGILQDAKPKQGTPETLSAVYSIKVNKMINNNEQGYYVGETISQEVSSPTDNAIVYTAIGTVVGWDEENLILRYIQDPLQHVDKNHLELFPFYGGISIKGDTSGYESLPDVNFNEELEDLAFEYGYAEPEINRYEGMITYLSNQAPIQRDSEQTERVSLLIHF